MLSQETVSRRGYMKYIGGIVVVAVVAAAGYGIYEATKPPPTTPRPTPSPTPTIVTETVTKTVTVKVPTAIVPATVVPQVVTDPSLIAPPGLDFTEPLVKERRLKYILTPEMLEVFKRPSQLKDLFTIWRIDPKYVEQTTDFFSRTGFLKTAGIICLPEDIRKAARLLSGKITELEPLATFIADEIGTVLLGLPILCTAITRESAPRWAIVEIFEEIGVEFTERIYVPIEEKAKWLRTEDDKIMYLTKVLNAAFVYAEYGALAAIEASGATAIRLLIYCSFE